MPHAPARALSLLLASAALTQAGAPARADSIILDAIADNTIYAEDGTESNGIGSYFFAGRTSAGEVRRALIRFDLAPIPPGSVITGASMRLTMTRTRGGSTTVNLHRLLASWGEAGSHSTGGEGRGDPAFPGDATWTHRFFPDTTWAAPGGQFNAGSSGSTAVGGNGNYTWSAAGMAADAQAWVNDPATNHGWILIAGETGGTTAKRFSSRNNTIVTEPNPALTITFTPPPNTGSCCTPTGQCIIRTAADCAAVGGTFRGVGTSCNPNPCPPPTGACCLPTGLCVVRTLAQCTTQGGTYRGHNTICDAVYCPVVLTPYVDPLPILPVAQPVTGQSGGAAHYVIPMTEFTQRLHRDLPPTRVWGYAGSFPGPTIEAHRGQPVTVTWVNDLRDPVGNLRTTHYLPVDECLHGPNMTGQVPVTVVHLHGGKVAPDSDGYPEASFPPGQQSSLYTYPNDQAAASVWYHDHALGISRLNAYMGLAGMYIVRDPIDDALNIPRGQFEIPLIIHDRSFNPDGSLVYPDMWHEHFFGDKILVNGKIWPFLDVAQGKYRFRVLNASTSRTYTLALSDGFPFRQIGTDLGLLPSTISRTSITLQPGERADLIFNFGIYPVGATVDLINSASAPFPGIPGDGVVPEVMRFNIIDSPGFAPPVPAVLTTVPRIPESQAIVHRDFLLERGPMDPMCMHEPWLINGMHWDNLEEFPRLGDTEVWSWINRSPVSHPMHIHLVAAQVLDRQDFTIVDGQIVPSGPRVPPAAAEAGWKDTIQAPPMQITRVIARFDGYTGIYAYHCHILEHEDHEMMRQFRIVCPADFNRDGATDPDDLSDFITCFFLDVQFPGTCPESDFNRDGFRDPDDLSDYITAFFLGGC